MQVFVDGGGCGVGGHCQRIAHSSALESITMTGGGEDGNAIQSDNAVVGEVVDTSPPATASTAAPSGHSWSQLATGAGTVTTATSAPLTAAGASAGAGLDQASFIYFGL